MPTDGRNEYAPGVILTQKTFIYYMLAECPVDHPVSEFNPRMLPFPVRASLIEPRDLTRILLETARLLTKISYRSCNAPM